MAGERSRARVFDAPPARAHDLRNSQRGYPPRGAPRVNKSREISARKQRAKEGKKGTTTPRENEEKGPEKKEKTNGPRRTRRAARNGRCSFVLVQVGSLNVQCTSK